MAKFHGAIASSHHPLHSLTSRHPPPPPSAFWNSIPRSWFSGVADCPVRCPLRQGCLSAACLRWSACTGWINSNDVGLPRALRGSPSFYTHSPASSAWLEPHHPRCSRNTICSFPGDEFGLDHPPHESRHFARLPTATSRSSFTITPSHRALSRGWQYR